MSITGKVALLISILALAAVSAQAGQVPYDISVVLGDQNFSVMNGNESYQNMNCTWTINDSNGTFRFLGSFPDGLDLPPMFDLSWQDAGADFPLSVSVTSSGSGMYSIAPYFFENQGDDPDLSLAQSHLTGDSTFGQYFPDFHNVHFQVYLEEPLVDYDLTVTLDWGLGVSTDTSSWDLVKSLYR